MALTDSQKIDAMVTALHTLIDHLKTQKLTLDSILAELQRPPSNDLRDTLKALVNEVSANTKHLSVIKGRLDSLPAEVAKQVRD